MEPSSLHCVPASLRENNIQTVFLKRISRRDAEPQGKNGEDPGENLETFVILHDNTFNTDPSRDLT
jgi:hypothetical protein